MTKPPISAPRGCWCAGSCPHMTPIAELEAKGRFAAAERSARSRLAAAPDCPALHKRVAGYLQNRNHAHDAGAHLARALELEGDSPELGVAIATNFRQQARIADAIEAAANARASAPDSLAAHVAFCYALHAAGERERAGQAVAAMLGKFGPAAAGVRRVRALVAADWQDWAQAIEILSGDDLSPIELLDRGRAKEKLADYAGAWSDWMAAKRYQREHEKLIYNPDAYSRHVAELMDASRPPRVNALRRSSIPGPNPRPLFITGFPRSGTTMIEAALSAHPLIAGGDEMHALPELLRLLPAYLNTPAELTYPRCLMAFAWPENAGVADLVRAGYMTRALNRLGAAAAGRAYFTDKMPSNELHMPLIAAVFPESPIVHVRRHPLDILVSCMSQFLVNGGHNACSLEGAAHHYALTDALVDHYRRKCRPPLLREVRYESFVVDVAGGVDKILPAELERVPACTDFHLSAWHSRTLSYRQIKEPVHDKSVGRFRPFLDFLRPILPAVQPTLDREGYTL